jgi:hypothetical protein
MPIKSFQGRGHDKVPDILQDVSVFIRLTFPINLVLPHDHLLCKSYGRPESIRIGGDLGPNAYGYNSITPNDDVWEITIDTDAKWCRFDNSLWFKDDDDLMYAQMLL